MSTSPLWHPAAKRLEIPGVPDLTFVGGGHKMVWHTTEGTSAEGAIATYGHTKSVPHFTIALQPDNTRALYQHIALDRASTCLQHPRGTPDTNRANAIQVEIVGFAAQSASFPPGLYRYLHLLAKYVHEHCEVPLTEDVYWRKPRRLSPSAFYDYSGHAGHMHVPGNDHMDPGFGFNIGYVLNGP
jgi:hypothetical protein